MDMKVRIMSTADFGGERLDKTLRLALLNKDPSCRMGVVKCHSDRWGYLVSVAHVEFPDRNLLSFDLVRKWVADCIRTVPTPGFVCFISELPDDAPLDPPDTEDEPRVESEGCQKARGMV